VALAGAVTGCASYYSRTYETGPSYAYAAAPAYYTTGYTYSAIPDGSAIADGYDSKWDYYRNYNGVGTE
jgi:hypothetical protein